MLSWHKHKHSNGRLDMPFGPGQVEGAGRREEGGIMDGWMDGRPRTDNCDTLHRA